MLFFLIHFSISCMQNAPTQSLLSVVNSILDESVERQNSEIPHVCNMAFTYITEILLWFKMYANDLFFLGQRVACLLRKVVQEIERRISTQAEHLRTVKYALNSLKFNFKCMLSLLLLCINFLLHPQQNNLFKAREEKYQSRIRVLEALASGTYEETEVRHII